MERQEVMPMKKFLILFTLITYSLAGCAGSNKWTRPDFDPNEFNKDREQCIQSIDKDLSPEDFGKTLEECLGKKNYKYHQAEVRNRRYQWTKPDFRPEESRKDREEEFREHRNECIQSIDRNLVSEAFGKALEECLAEKGYKYHQTEIKHSQVKYNNLTTAETILLSLILIPVGAAILILSSGGGGTLGGFGH
jgi:hypothetical protein